MKEMLTVRIINALENEFLQYLLLEIKKEKRQSLFILIKNILQYKDDLEIDRHLIFKKIFKKNWTKENDYLLRNELKLLKDKIEYYYIKYSSAIYLQKIEDKILLDLYKQIRVSDEYFLLNKKYISRKRNELDFNSLVENNFNYADFVRTNVPNYQERAVLLEQNLNEIKKNIIDLFAQQTAKAFTLNAHYLLQQKQLDNKKKDLLFEYTDIHFSKEVFKNNLNDYFVCYANASINFDTASIEQWEEVYQKLKAVDPQYFNFDYEHCLTLSMLATICSIRNQYEKSQYYFNLLFDEIPLSIVNKNINIYLNYITNLNKLKKYEDAMKQLQYAKSVFGGIITKIPQYRTQELVTAIYLNDLKKIKTIMNVDFDTLQAFERIFYRFFYCIYFIIEKQYNLAFIEIQNLQRSKLINETDNFAKLVADYFYVCIKNLNIIAGAKNKLSKNQLKEIIIVEQKITDSKLPLLSNYAPYIWMKDLINSLS
jgi:hypothetical protein